MMIGKSDAAHHGLDVLALGLGRRPGLAHGDVPLELDVLAANNYIDTLLQLGRFEEAKVMLRKTIPVARVLGNSHHLTLKLKWHYARALSGDTSATLDDLREAVTTLEETSRIARRLLGGEHPAVRQYEATLRAARELLRARETPSRSA
jgi:hypothetical protein